MQWKHLFIHPDDEASVTDKHIVRSSPHMPLLEVAVPIDTPPCLPYRAMPSVPRVSIDLLITRQDTNELGLEGAFRKQRDLFLERARTGIAFYGAGLGDWYRSRYPNFQSQVEYMILLRDLPPVLPCPCTWETELFVRFTQHALIMAFKVIKPHEAVSKDLQALDSAAVLKRIKRSLESRLSGDHSCPMQEQEIASRVRLVLVNAEGPSNQTQMEQLGHQTENIDISLTFRHLLCGDASPRQHVHIDEIVSQIESSYAFRGISERSSEIRKYVEELSERMDICSSFRMNCLPRSWIAGLEGRRKKSFDALVREAAGLLRGSMYPGSTRQLYVIWNHISGYLLGACEIGIHQHSNDLFREATETILARETPATQLIVNTMVLYCLTKVVKAPLRTKRSSSDILGQFDNVLNREGLGDDTICLWRCLLSLRRVLGAWDFPRRNPRLVSFISRLQIPDLMPEGSEFVIDYYWGYRLLWKMSHVESLQRARQRSGFFPVNLPPLQISEETTTKAEAESEEDCIMVNTDAIRKVTGPQSLGKNDSIVMGSVTPSGSPEGSANSDLKIRVKTRIALAERRRARMTVRRGARSQRSGESEI